jgi:sulfhydrogenase subunit alpha
MAIARSEAVKIDVHPVTRVEGHGHIVVHVQDRLVTQCELQIVEAPRFFEAMVRGLPYWEAPRLTSRICGICAVAHSTASIRAVEKALDVEPSPQTVLLRNLLLCSEMLDSHILHVYMLVAPDLLGTDSAIALARSNPDVVVQALRMKKVAGDFCTALAGRHTHPLAMTVGGFTHFPSTETLAELGRRLELMRTDMAATIELFQSLSLPDFERETEYLALHRDDEYCFMDGTIMSSDGGRWSPKQYRSVTNEFQVGHSTAKHTRHQRPSYMVGSLARFNLNYDQLHTQAKAAAADLGLSPGCSNPYMNTTAQVVEMVHCLEEAIQLVQQILDQGITWERPAEPGRLSGEGVGAVEAPRGTLYHNYAVKNGLITGANCIIPTNQNLANIEADMRALVPGIVDRSPDEITLALEMLVRAYDPCISCATHMLEVEFV